MYLMHGTPSMKRKMHQSIGGTFCLVRCMKSKGKKLDRIYNDGVLDFQLIFHVFSSGGDNCGPLTYHKALEEIS